jgi:hypothetical protein
MASIVIFAGSAVTALPAALTDADAGPDANMNGPRAAAGELIQNLWLAELPTPTAAPATAASATAGPTVTSTPAPPTRKPTAKPKPKPITYADTVAGARAYVRAHIGTAQYNCIDAIFTRESKWNPTAGKLTGAYGIPQAFPGSKMAKFGSNWATSPLTQVKWGIWYVNGRYGSACKAWTFWQANGWY